MQPEAHRERAFDNENHHLSESLGNLRNRSFLRNQDTPDQFCRLGFLINSLGRLVSHAYRRSGGIRTINLTRSINLDTGRVLVSDSTIPVVALLPRNCASIFVKKKRSRDCS